LAASLWSVFTILNALFIHDPENRLFVLRVVIIVIDVGYLLATCAWPSLGWRRPWCVGMTAVNIVFLTLVLALMSTVSLPFIRPEYMLIVEGAICFALPAFGFIDGVLLLPLVVASFFVAAVWLWPEPPVLTAFNAAWLSTIVLMCGVGSYLLDRTRRLAWLGTIELADAENRVRTLLHNILPPSIASRKLSGELTIADEYGEASVLFADIVGFTALSSRLSPTVLVGMLNALFARFDRIVASAGLEKIKTIGDCYMVAAGVPEAQPDHLAKLLRVAVDMLTASESMKAPDGSPILIRIGVHVGPVTAGVIGESKFIFDVWGDTVNVASRMESNGAAGSIQVTEAVVTAMSDRYGFDGPALVDVKGKGPTRVWRLKRADRSCASAI
jgi:class 3 adenylate cyclase